MEQKDGKNCVSPESSDLTIDVMKAMMRLVKAAKSIGEEQAGFSREFGYLQAIRCMGKEMENSVCVSQLAVHMEVSSPAISRKLKPLEESGLIARTIDSKDRRNILVTLTPKGEQQRRHQEAYLNEYFRRVFQRVGYEDISKLMEVLNKTADAIREEAEYQKSNRKLASSDE